MTTPVGLFNLPCPQDADVPNGPSQLFDILVALDTQLRKAGAQAKRFQFTSEESTTSTSYTLLGNPDQVTNIVLPTGGLIFVAYQALVKTANVNAKAAIFLDNGQLIITGGASPSASEAGLATGAGSTNYGWLTTIPLGLAFTQAPTGDAVETAVATTVAAATPGIAAPDFAGLCVIRAPADTYDVGIRFKAGASGQAVSAKSRKLWVWTQEFA